LVPTDPTNTMFKKYHFFLVLAFVYIGGDLEAQDQHFSQFYASPLTLNPALTGAFNGSYRFGMNYRDQGRSLVEVPYSTISAAIDVRFGLDSRRRARRDKAGVGMVFYNDRSQSVNFFTNYIGVSGAFHKALSKNEDQYLSIGFQGGVGQRNVNYDNFSFDDQFDGSSNFDLPSGEVLPENNFSYSDLATGINYSYTPEGRIGFYLGAGLHHILEPQISFYTLAEEPGTSLLYRKYTAHIGLKIPVGNKVEFSPRALAYFQGPHTAYNGGANLRFEFGSKDNAAFHIGGWGRLTTNVASTISLDSAVFFTGLEFNSFLVGFSYDAKLLSISTGGRSQGALEFSITYIGNYDNSADLMCPAF